MPAAYLWLIPLLPFAGFLINGILGRKFPRALVTAVALICTAIPALLVAWLWITLSAPGAPEVMNLVSGPKIGKSWLAMQLMLEPIKAPEHQQLTLVNNI